MTTGNGQHWTRQNSGFAGDGMKGFRGLSWRIGIAGAILLGTPAGAAPDRTPFNAEYDFYIGGLPIAELTLHGTVGDLGYDARSIVQTRGLLNLLANGEVIAAAEGYRHAAGYLTPDAYDTAIITSSDERRITIAYDDEIAEVSVLPPEDASPSDAVAEAYPGTLDPVTAVVTIMSPKPGNGLCNRTIPIFDGKRRYDIILLPVEQRGNIEMPPEPEIDLATTQCFGVYERIDGFDTDLQTEQRFYPFDIWFERDSKTSVHRIVRLSGKTNLGYAIGMLREE